MLVRSGVNVLKIFVLFVSLSVTICHAQDRAHISLDRLLSFNSDWGKLHEAVPMGVPSDYAWALKSRLGAGNKPEKFGAAIGWGQAFWSKDTVGHPGPLQIRKFQSYICSGVDRRWVPMQSGKIEGAQFRADFKENLAKVPERFENIAGTVTVLFEPGRVFHFWPTKRTKLPQGEICGFVVLLEARTDPSSLGDLQTLKSGGYLIGLGADYWSDMTSGWDHFKTNTDIAMGHLKYVGTNWGWYGLSTANDRDLKRLFESGLLSGEK